MINRENYQLTQRYLAYLAEVEQLQGKTLANKRVHLRHLLEWADAHSFAQAPDVRPTLPRYLLSARDDGADKPLSRDHMAKICGTARKFFAWLRLLAPGRFKDLTPAWIATLAPVRRPGDDAPAERDIYTLADVRALLAAPAEKLTHRRTRAGVAMLFLSGMRVGAFVTLRTPALHLRFVQVQVSNALTWRNASSSSGRPWAYTPRAARPPPPTCWISPTCWP